MIKPTVAYELFGGKVEVLIYGKSPCDLEEAHIVQIAHELELKNVYRPLTHTFNAKICPTRHFKKEIASDEVKICAGILADGVSFIGINEAVWLRTADCPTIIGHNTMTGEMIAAHAGLASLIDQVFVNTGGPSRQPESVVQAMYERLTNLGGTKQTPTCVNIYSCCGIGPLQFRNPVDHPRYGTFNREMNRHIALNYGTDCFLDGKTSCGALDLHRLIRNQFELCGVPGDNIHHDNIDTAGQTDYFFSRRGGNKTGSNTILVIRRA